MKIAFIVHNEYMTDQMMQLLKACDIDYYTRWDQTKGKGRGTEPHLGSGAHATTNTVLMIAFPEEEPLEKLIEAITATNTSIRRGDDKIRLFQMPLERMV
jgi:nitrogen regulatory protein PII